MKLIFVFLSTVCLLTGILFFVRSTEISYICSIPADSLKQKGVPTENNEFILGDTKYGSILENILKERGCSIRQTSRKSIVAVRGMKLHKFRAPRACINYTYSTLLLSRTQEKLFTSITTIHSIGMFLSGDIRWKMFLMKTSGDTNSSDFHVEFSTEKV